MYILLAGKHPFYKHDETTNRYIGKMLNPTWSHTLKCSEYYIFLSTRNRLAHDLLAKMCSPNVLNRYSAADAMQHPWITGYPQIFIIPGSNTSVPAPLTYLEQFLSGQMRSAIRSLFFLSVCRANTAGSGDSSSGSYLPLNRVSTDSESPPSGSPSRALNRIQQRGCSLAVHKGSCNSPLLAGGKRTFVAKAAATASPIPYPNDI